MTAVLPRHESLMRQAIESRGGYVFGTAGDAFCAAFDRPLDAALAAIECQRNLLAEDFSQVGGLKVRMALHTGTADERDGDYFGPAVNRVARLLAIGYGGQILASATTSELIEGDLPVDARLRDLGEHRLRDLSRAEHVYQLSARGLPDDFPRLRSPDQMPNNLPLQLTSFVGRERELSAIKELLEQERLVTLVGTAGVGKTRCAIQAGAELLGEYEAGIWLIELAPLVDSNLVTAQIAQTLGVRGDAAHTPLDSILSQLQHQHVLLILDNCEHVIEEVRRTVAAILRSCPKVHILATGIESLNIAGERVFRLPPLAVPRDPAVATVSAALPFGGVALFADRARAADSQFALTDENVPYVSEVCRRLDGVPLALELAAARIRVLSPRQLAAKLDERFRVLTGGDRSALARHQTMRALLDWSYELLTERERAFFRKLSIFAGSFSLESAAKVAAAADDEIGALDLLSSLVNKSLVQADPFTGIMRYRLLESTRQYARDRLRESAEYAAEERAYAVAFVDLAEQLETGFSTTADREWVEQVTAELENWRAVLEWALGSRNDVIIGQRLVGALRQAWPFLTAGESRRWISAAVNSADAATPEPVTAKLELAEAALNAALRQYKPSYEAADRALARYRQLEDALKIADAQRHVATALTHLGEAPAAEGMLYEALAAARKRNESKLAAAVLECLAEAREQSDDFERARLFYAEALAFHKGSNDNSLAVARIANNLSDLEFHAGNVSRALELVDDALAAHPRPPDSSKATFLCNRAMYLTALSRYAEAIESARESLALAGSAGDEWIALLALQHVGAICALQTAKTRAEAIENYSRAARLMGYVDLHLNSLGALREPGEEREYQAAKSALLPQLGAEYERLHGEGQHWSEDEATQEARQALAEPSAGGDTRRPYA